GGNRRPLCLPTGRKERQQECALDDRATYTDHRYLTTKAHMHIPLRHSRPVVVLNLGYCFILPHQREMSMPRVIHGTVARVDVAAASRYTLLQQRSESAVRRAGGSWCPHRSILDRFPAPPTN